MDYLVLEAPPTAVRRDETKALNPHRCSFFPQLFQFLFVQGHKDLLDPIFH